MKTFDFLILFFWKFFIMSHLLFLSKLISGGFWKQLKSTLKKKKSGDVILPRSAKTIWTFLKDHGPSFINKEVNKSIFLMRTAFIFFAFTLQLLKSYRYTLHADYFPIMKCNSFDPDDSNAKAMAFSEGKLTSLHAFMAAYLQLSDMNVRKASKMLVTSDIGHWQHTRHS